jgi:hypothetical protein
VATVAGESPVGAGRAELTLTAACDASFSGSIRFARSRGRDIPIERRRRDAEAMRDLGDADVGIGEQCPRGFKVFLCQLRRATSSAAGMASSGEARLGALPDQAALELRHAPNL